MTWRISLQLLSAAPTVRSAFHIVMHCAKFVCCSLWLPAARRKEEGWGWRQVWQPVTLSPAGLALWDTPRQSAQAEPKAQEPLSATGA